MLCRLLIVFFLSKRHVPTEIALRRIRVTHMREAVLLYTKRKLDNCCRVQLPSGATVTVGTGCMTARAGVEGQQDGR